MYIIKGKSSYERYGVSFVRNNKDLETGGWWCIFPTKEMAETVLEHSQEIFPHDSKSYYIEEIPDDYFYQVFLSIPENAHLRRDCNIDQILEPIN